MDITKTQKPLQEKLDELEKFGDIDRCIAEEIQEEVQVLKIQLTKPDKNT